MTPDKLAALLTNLEAAAEVVDAIEDPDLQRRRGWDLACWRYDLVPFGVRFSHANERDNGPAEIFVVLRPASKRHGPARMDAMQPGAGGLR